jgi:uncharacterized membrane protein YeaQ/YmgE (transglycosylase-associated protein family)
MNAIVKQMHNLNARIFASNSCETHSHGAASAGFFLDPSSMGEALMAGPVIDAPAADPSEKVFLGLTGGFSGASIHGRRELQEGSPILDALLVALQGAIISFGMPGMQLVSFRLPAGISWSTVIDVLFGLFGQWIAMLTAGHVPCMPVNGHWLEAELPAFIRAAVIMEEWHHIRLAGIRHIGGNNWAAVFRPYQTKTPVLKVPYISRCSFPSLLAAELKVASAHGAQGTSHFNETVPREPPPNQACYSTSIASAIQGHSALYQDVHSGPHPIRLFNW